MELAFVLLFVLLGVGGILYAGMRTPPAKAEPVDETIPADAPGDDGTGAREQG